MKRLPPIEFGTRFGILTAKEELDTINGIRWQKVECDCGTVKSVRAANLRNGSISSCGCNHSAPSKSRRKIPDVGAVYEKWTFLGGEKSIKNQMHGEFQCVCGTKKYLLITMITQGKSKSCGCDRKRVIKHGKAGTPMHMLWKRLKARCLNPKSADYKDYGARGITIYEPWINDFTEFDNYVLANLGERPSKEYSLDRIDNNLGYQPGNIRWATHVEQANNKRNNLKVIYQDTEVTLNYLSTLCDISYDTLHSRIFIQNWDVEEAMNTPTGR